MLEQLTRDLVYDLARPAAGCCLSIYLPGDESRGRGAALRLERMRSELRDALAGSPRPPEPLDQYLGAAGGLIDELIHRSNDDAPLAILARPEQFVVCRLPAPVRELMVLGPRLHLKPLLPMVDASAAYYLLALSKRDAQLYRGAGPRLEPLALPGAPAGLSGLLQYDEFAAQHQLHAGIPGRGGERGPIFHGQGSAADELKPQLRRYCQEIDRALHEALPAAREPLVLCGAAYLMAIFRAVSRYPQICDAQIPGSPQRFALAALGARAAEIAGARAEGGLAAARARYSALAAGGLGATATALRQILPAAAAGGVDTAFVALDQEQWGRYEPATGHVQLHERRQPDDEDLLNTVAIETLLHGGAVYALAGGEAPAGGGCAAILRDAFRGPGAPAERSTP